jgi:glycosyltransferase involved in cell wall biosynthesis/SAM-dependent methyltransferase
MKILMLNYEYPPLGGGGGVAHQHIAEELASRHDVTVLTSRATALPPFEIVGGVNVHRVDVLGRNSQATASLISMLSFFPASFYAGQRLINKIKPDIINSHFAIPTGPSAALLARRNRIPHVLSIHGGDIYDPSKRLSPHHTPGLHQTVGWVLRCADRVAAQSENTADNARRIYGYQKEITIIPLGLKEPVLPLFSRKELGLSDDQVVLVTVGRLIARKANHHLIEILSRINNPKLVLVLLGEGPARMPLLELAKRLRVENRVIMPGFVSEERKYRYLQAADVFVSTTSHEGFGLMYVEGMFCRLPIVTYNHGGQNDFLENGKTGFLVPLNDQETFRQRLEWLIQSPEIRKTMGEYNLALSRRFIIRQCALQYEQLFEEMISGGPQSRAFFEHKRNGEQPERRAVSLRAQNTSQNPTTTCRICQNEAGNRSFAAREMMFGFRDKFQYFECAKCGCVQIEEVPPNLTKYYPESYYSFQKAGGLKSLIKKRWASYSYNGVCLIGRAMASVLGKNQSVESVKRANVSKEATILDLGCGSGELLLVLHSLGFKNLTGADPFLSNEIIYENGVKVWKKDLNQITQRFDVIMSHHSFEHMTNPVEILTHAARLLNPGGVVIVRVPIAGTFAWKTYGTNWVQLDPPRHIFLPTVKSMEILARKTGLELAEVIHESGEFQFWGSEQYLRDIPLRDARSLASLSKQVLARNKIKKYREQAAELNAKGEGDSACFYFRKDSCFGRLGKH